MWEGKPFSLNDYPMFRAVYDDSPQKMLLKTCRQVGKSMTLSTFALGECVAIPHFKTFFIAPTKEQTQTFSVSRVGKFILFSPLVRDIFVDEGTTNRVLARYFSHGSQIEFSYASDDADRCRGRSCDRLMLDEVQQRVSRNVSARGLPHAVWHAEDHGERDRAAVAGLHADRVGRQVRRVRQVLDLDERNPVR